MRWRNVLPVPDGQRVFLDWGGCRIFAEVWDPAYFIDLLRAVWHGTNRDLPIAEERMVGWYQEALHERGIGPRQPHWVRPSGWRPERSHSGKTVSPWGYGISALSHFGAGISDLIAAFRGSHSCIPPAYVEG